LRGKFLAFPILKVPMTTASATSFIVAALIGGALALSPAPAQAQAPSHPAHPSYPPQARGHDRSNPGVHGRGHDRSNPGNPERGHDRSNPGNNGHHYGWFNTVPSAPASRAELIRALAHNNAQAIGPASRLAANLDSPPATPAQYAALVKSYNEFVGASSAQFLSAPPPEFLAIHQELQQLGAAHLASK
jgi:hypothetical protein